MLNIPKVIAIACLILMLVLSLSPGSDVQAQQDTSKLITEWQMAWGERPAADHEWFNVDSINGSTVTPPDGVTDAWIRSIIPPQNGDRGLLVEKLYAQEVRIYLNDRLIYHANRDYRYDQYRILLPLPVEESEQEILIELHGNTERLGLQKPIRMDQYSNLLQQFASRDLQSFIIGASLLMIAIFLFLCLLMMKRINLLRWSSLVIVMFSIGVMIMTYSPYLYAIYPQYGQWFYFSFDLVSNLVLPALYLFFEQIIGWSIIRRMRLGLTLAFGICMVSMFLHLFWDVSWTSNLYYQYVSLLFGVSLMIGGLLLPIVLILAVSKGNRDSLFASIGFTIFAGVTVYELIWYYVQDHQYELYLWKWGVLCFVLSLLVIFGRHMQANYEKVVNYSKQLESYNAHIQRSEKMEIISQLAASIAHEVRNPLQVTRGFLQLLGEKSNSDKERNYMLLAVNELDRAAGIITDFLTFAKPQQGQVSVINISEELRQIEGIIKPLSQMEGGEIKLNIQANLFISGNSSKFKQAFINMIKNSIEAFEEDGCVEIRAYEDINDAVIHIRDNGIGMNESELKRLGEPYFSNKTKGTGLGLMVTFKIIEVMQGNIQFHSIQGEGTEAVIRFPLVKSNAV
ncbi:ATP-binding protein [Paenibacillus sp. GCM10023252]|uniref:ATP-binding protein n=1 Tax=Paenibacillus sp. GCM10023252 TaxID=3252649 RepID=UPI003614A79B